MVSMPQARLAGALAALKRSRSADNGQDALIQMLQSMLNGAARQHNHDDQVLAAHRVTWLLTA